MIPDDILNLAAETQATLGDKLAALRSLSEPFPDAVGPAASDGWMSGPGSTGSRIVTGGEETRPPPPTRGDHPAVLSAAALMEGYRTGALNPVEVIETCLARISDADAAAGAVATRNDGGARVQATRSAERWRNGNAGPLEGVPVGVKDIIDTAGLATTAGSSLYAGRIPTADATVVARLREAGAVIVAKTTTPEFAFGDETGDGVTNPAALGRWAGGSSSGSAAGLAAGLFPVALGTGNRRLDPGAVVVLRRERPQAHVRPSAPRRRVRGVLDAGPCGPHGPHHRGSGVGARRDRGWIRH